MPDTKPPFNAQQIKALESQLQPLAKSLQENGVSYKGEAFGITLAGSMAKQSGQKDQEDAELPSETKDKTTKQASQIEHLHSLGKSTEQIGDILVGNPSHSELKDLGQGLRSAATQLEQNAPDILKRVQDNEEQRLASQEFAKNNLIMQERKYREDRDEQLSALKEGFGKAVDDIASVLLGVYAEKSLDKEMPLAAKETAQQIGGNLSKAGVEVAKTGLLPAKNTPAEAMPEKAQVQQL